MGPALPLARPEAMDLLDHSRAVWRRAVEPKDTARRAARYAREPASREDRVAEAAGFLRLRSLQARCMRPHAAVWARRHRVTASPCRAPTL